jgi:hypothetical protein
VANLDKGRERVCGGERGGMTMRAGSTFASHVFERGG